MKRAEALQNCSLQFDKTDEWQSPRKCSMRMLIHITNGLLCNLLKEINPQLEVRQLLIHPTSEMVSQIPYCDTSTLLMGLMKLQNWITVK